nr:MAG TPA: hypothetical protein [Caudoviricetes sp.]
MSKVVPSTHKGKGSESLTARRKVIASPLSNTRVQNWRNGRKR